MRTRKLAAVSAVAAFGLVATVPATTHAQDRSAEVESLFAEGKKLVAEGKLDLACPKFLASYNLDARVGTLLNLADCYERNGQLASAWTRFLEVKPRAEQAKQQERADYAAQHAAALEARVARLTIVVPSRVDGLEIKRDGVLVEPSAYGVAVPVDRGTHVVTASAPRKRSWSANAIVAKDGERPTLTVSLVDEPTAPVAAPVAVPVAAPPTPVPPPAAPASSPPTADSSGGSNGRKILGLVIAGVGVVGVGVGAGFGIAALGKNSDASPYCGQNGAGVNDCFGPGVGYRADAVSSGNLSTIFFAAGAALVTGGLVLWLTAPSRSSNSNAHLQRGAVVF
ncbi:MAG: hypothetical protein JWO86_384 [Myxococcaceae bacterium]|nr:hypothetical protein [Myxococcaceae bacterium]